MMNIDTSFRDVGLEMVRVGEILQQESLDLSILGCGISIFARQSYSPRTRIAQMETLSQSTNTNCNTIISPGIELNPRRSILQLVATRDITRGENIKTECDFVLCDGNNDTENQNDDPQGTNQQMNDGSTISMVEFLASHPPL